METRSFGYFSASLALILLTFVSGAGGHRSPGGLALGVCVLLFHFAQEQGQFDYWAHHGISYLPQ